MLAKINHSKLKIFLTFLLSGLYGCGGGDKQNEQEVEDQMFNEVMAIHDEVMPKTGELYSLRKELENELVELDSTSESFREIQDGIESLEMAEEAMMSWMRGYEINQEGWSHDSIMSYLGRERVKILEVREQINNSLDLARQLLGQSVQ